MNYYLIKNIILSDTSSDEPAWLQDEKVNQNWIRFGAIESKEKYGNGLNYTLIASDINLKKYDQKDTLQELTKEEAQNILILVFPYKDYEIINPDKTITNIIIDTPDVYQEAKKKFQKSQYGMGLNHSGNIGTETWALADSPHHLTGNVTVTSGTLTIEAGCEIIADANYSLTATAGKITANGTATSKIIFYSGIANPLYTSHQGLWFDGAGTGNSIKHWEIRDSEYGVVTHNSQTGTVTLQYLDIHHCYYGVYVNTNMTLENSKIRYCYWGNGHGNATWTVTRCTIIDCIDSCLTVNTGGTIIGDYLCLGGNRNVRSIFVQGTGTFSLNHSFVTGSDTSNTFTTSTNITIQNTVFSKCNGNPLNFSSSADGTITNCDFINNKGIVNGGGGFTDCYFAGNTSTASENCIDTTADAGTNNGVFDTSSTETPQQFTNVDFVVGNKSTPNFLTIASSIVDTVNSDTQVTITWTTTALSNSRVKIGTVAGTYDNEYQENNEWSDFKQESDGFVTSHSVVIKNLKAGITYYYKVASQDLREIEDQELEWSAEGDFATTSSSSTISNVTVSPTSITTAKTTLVTITTTGGTPATVGVKINGIIFLASGSAGTYTATILGLSVGTGTTMSVVGVASGATDYTSANTLTVTQSSYTNYFDNLINDLRTIFRTEFSGAAVYKGDLNVLGQVPAIGIEPADKITDSEFSNNKKNFTFRVNIWLYLTDSNDDNAVIQITDFAEHVEELLIDNKKYPSGNGNSWRNSFVERTEFGLKANAKGVLLRTARITWSGLYETSL